MDNKMKTKMRPPVLNDAEKTAAMFNRFEKHVEGEESTQSDILRKEWQFPGFTLDEDARLLENDKGEILGFSAVWNSEKPHVSNFIIQRIAPEYIGTEVEERLTDWTESKAMENISKAPEGSEVILGTTINSNSSDKIQRMKDRGFEEKRYYWRMGIDLTKDLQDPELPRGITVERHSDRQNLPEIVHCDRDCFKDHWGYVEGPFEDDLNEWKHWLELEPYYDPRYWFLACSEGEIVGLCLCMNGMTIGEEIGYIDSVCVKKEFRKKGIAAAMLRYSFRELKKAGRTSAYLHVDASSLTGATRLYKSVGMSVNKMHTKVEKVIRPINTDFQVDRIYIIRSNVCI
jgi:ribosomal protein S18 acetylase RimI-like enzyme